MGTHMSCCCMTCRCMSCFLDNYLHIYIREIKNIKGRHDINLSGTFDLSLTFTWNGKSQDTKVLKGEKGTAVFNEPIILEDAEPNTNTKLVIELWEVDTATSDDFMGRTEIDMPSEYGKNLGEKEYELRSKDGQVTAVITLDQVHFIRQKLRRYTGACKCCCCCLYKGSY